MYVSTHTNLLNAKAQFMPKWKSATSINENYLALSLKLNFSIEFFFLFYLKPFSTSNSDFTG